MFENTFIIFYIIFPAGSEHRTDVFTRRQRRNSKIGSIDFPIMKCSVISYSFFLKIDRSVRGRVKMPEDIKYDCQVLIKSKVTRYFDIFPWYLVYMFTKNPKYYFYFVHPFQESSELITFWWFLNQIWETEFWGKKQTSTVVDICQIPLKSVTLVRKYYVC